MASRLDSGTEAEFLWEQRRSWLCFGWHQPLVTPRWADKQGQSLVAASGRPRTRAYRRVFKEKDDGQQDWEWCIVVNEETDEAGWSYGGCGFWELFQQRMSLRSRPSALDLVKRRKWVHRSHAASLRRTGKMGSTKVMDPKQILEKQKAVKKELQEAKAAIWDLIDELDKSIHIKDVYMALLDPVALNRVSTAHVKGMLELQQSVLKLPAVLLQPVEVWKEALAEAQEHQRRSAFSDSGVAPRTDSVDDDGSWNLAHRFVSRTRLLVKLTQKKTVMMAKEAGDLVANTGNAVKSVIHKMTPGWDLASYGSAPGPGSLEEPRPGIRPAFSDGAELAAGEQATSRATPAHSAGPSSAECVGGGSTPPQSARGVIPGVGSAAELGLVLDPAPCATPARDADPAAVHGEARGLQQHDPRGSTVDVKLSMPPVRDQPAQAAKDVDAHEHQAPSSSGRDTSAAAATGGQTGNGGTAAAPASTAGSTEVLPSSPEPAAGPNSLHPKPVMVRAAAEGEQRPTSETKAAKLTPPAAAAGSVAASLSPEKVQDRTSLWRRSGRLARGTEPPTSGLFRKILSFLGPDHPDYAPETTGTSLSLSLPELKCAYLHACAVYGDLELYVDGGPAQTFSKAVTKFTDVPEEDVIYGVWRSEVYKPGHCLSIDRKMEKIVISIRGTYENSDIMSDLVARPVTRKFTEGLEGVVHIGILKAAEYVLQSVWSALQTALLLAPGLPILVTGHSMGGGAAGLLALMLRYEMRLPVAVRSRVRAVCLAPAAVMELELATACQSFVASVILGNDVVPRVGLHTFSRFVQEVAQASPYQVAKRRVKRTWRSLGRKMKRVAGRAPRKQRQRRASSRGEAAPGPRPAPSAAPPGEQPAAGTAGPDADRPSQPVSDRPSQPEALSGPVQHKALGCQLYAPGILLWVIPQETSGGVIQPAGFAGEDLDVPSPRVTSPKPPADQQQPNPMATGTDTLATILASELDKDPPKTGMFSCKCLAPQGDGEKSSKSSKEFSYEMRQVGPEVFSEIFFFQKALTDHLPLEYLKGMRALVLQQELAVHGQHDLRERHSVKRESRSATAGGFVRRTETFLAQLKPKAHKAITQTSSMPGSKTQELRPKHLKLRSSRW